MLQISFLLDQGPSWPQAEIKKLVNIVKRKVSVIWSDIFLKKINSINNNNNNNMYNNCTVVGHETLNG